MFQLLINTFVPSLVALIIIVALRSEKTSFQILYIQIIFKSYYANFFIKNADFYI